MSDLSEFEEMYLKRIFELHSDKPDQIVKTTQLAESMDVSAASTTQMLTRLTKKDLLTYIPYRGCRLTPEGFISAAKIKRREALVEILLVDVIGFKGDINAMACKIEHAIDEELEVTLDNMLGYPERSVSGSKIPLIDRKMEILQNNLLPLNCLPNNAEATIELIAMNDSEKKTLERFGLMLGLKINKIDEQFVIDGKNINMEMCKKGHAVAYYGQNKDLVEGQHLKNRKKLGA